VKADPPVVADHDWIRRTDDAPLADQAIGQRIRTVRAARLRRVHLARVSPEDCDASPAQLEDARFSRRDSIDRAEVHGRPHGSAAPALLTPLHSQTYARKRSAALGAGPVAASAKSGSERLSESGRGRWAHCALDRQPDAAREQAAGAVRSNRFAHPEEMRIPYPFRPCFLQDSAGVVPTNRPQIPDTF
jgi:hypothetical protein